MDTILLSYNSSTTFWGISKTPMGHAVPSRKFLLCAQGAETLVVVAAALLLL